MAQSSPFPHNIRYIPAETLSCCRLLSATCWPVDWGINAVFVFVETSTHVLLGGAVVTSALQSSLC